MKWILWRIIPDLDAGQNKQKKQWRISDKEFCKGKWESGLMTERDEADDTNPRWKEES